MEFTYDNRRRVLIIGSGSYIGSCFQAYLDQWPEKYETDCQSSLDLCPTPELFRGYDVSYNVAGIVHQKETKDNQQDYYKVNRDLAISLAKAAKEAGVKAFIQMSSFSVYGVLTGQINASTLPAPINAYGDSKLQADEALLAMADDQFRVVCLRSPMVYGKGCRGNYGRLRALALKTPYFPECNAERSMIYVGNLCEFVRRIVDVPQTGIFFPQNKEYVNVTEMVKTIAELNGKKMKIGKFLGTLASHLPVSAAKKVFGTLICEKIDTIDTFSFRESMELTER